MNRRSRSALSGHRGTRVTVWPATLLVALLCLGGCRVCAVPEDEAFGYYGGITVRADPYRGRVGSLFDDGSLPDYGYPVDSSQEISIDAEATAPEYGTN